MKNTNFRMKWKMTVGGDLKKSKCCYAVSPNWGHSTKMIVMDNLDGLFFFFFEPESTININALLS